MKNGEEVRRCPKCRHKMEPVMWHGRRWRCTNENCAVTIDPPLDVKVAKRKPVTIIATIK